MTRMEFLHATHKIDKAVYNIAMQVPANAVCSWLGI
ncbi:Protein of unknown function [Weissella confusa LBAE C39-2]|nr:Protein of unknown function [Weissella confusa LBAE C39-2]